MNTKALRQKVLDLAIHGKLVPPAYRQAGKSLENIPAEKEGQWFVYVIECVDGSFYKGFTTDLIKRYKQHCAGIGAEWTKTHKPKQLFYWEIHYSEKSAIEREKYLKSGCGREWFKNEVVDKPENWESATVLLEKIRAEKAEKIKKGLPAGRRGELKADKKDSFIFTKECEFDEDKLGKCSSGTRHKRHYEQFADGTVKDIEDEIPFEVPDGWAWIRQKNLGIALNGKAFKPSDWTKKGLPIVRIQNLNDKNAPYNYYDKDVDETFLLHGGELLFAWSGTPGTSFGAHIWDKGEAVLNQHIFKILFDETIINKIFYKYCLNNQVEKLIEVAHGSAGLAHITKNMFDEVLIPLPPYNEQLRIVTEFEKIISLINYINDNKTELNDTIKQTKSKILDLAIHGKLVPQDPNDEPAEELLKRIATSDNRPYKKFDKDDSPYTLPTNWAWCYLGDLCKISSAKRVLQQDWKDSGIPFYRAREVAQLSNNEKVKDDLFITPELYNELKSKYGVPSSGDLMISAVGTIGKIYIVKETDCFYYKDASVICFSKKEKNINSKFLKLCLESSFLQNQIYSQSTGTTVDTITINKAQEYLFPLPSIKEQSRIVSKIEELFSYLDNITLNLV